MIETDGWDGALWIMTKDQAAHFSEMQELREAVEKHVGPLGIVGSIFKSIVTETFT